jgi:hypothetical protein
MGVFAAWPETFKMKTLSKILLLVLAATPCMAQVATNDLFNRTNSGNLGIDWAEQDGDAQIAGNVLRANSPSAFGWCSHNAFAANYASTVVAAIWSTNGGGGDSISLLAGVNPVTWSGIEVRISDQDGDGASDRIIFNASVNAGAWYSPGANVNLTTPMASGEAKMWFSNNGDTVNVSLRDLVTEAVQTYSASGILASPPAGTRVGIGYFGNGSVEDFRAYTGSPLTPSLTITTPRSGAPTTMLISNAVSRGGAAIGFSVTGTGPAFTPFGVLGLSDPIELLWQGPTDGNGRVELPLGVLGNVTGLTVHVQALDFLVPALTNYFTITVL